jgi:hypothetical protein
MNTEKARLDQMVQEQKISPSDYIILANALKRKTLFNKIHSTFLLNPFQKIAGLKALFLGIITLLLTSYFGVKAKLYFLGPFSIINESALAKQSMSHPFAFLLYQNVVCWLVLAIVLMVTAKILQKNKIRMIDFLGTVALARFPFLILTVSLLLVRVFYPEILNVDFKHGLPLHPSMAQSLFGIIVTSCAIWQITVYFYAFKESSGLTDKKLWFGFFVAMGLAENMAQLLTTWFMN